LQAPQGVFFDTGLVEGDEGIRFENLMTTALLKQVQRQHDVLGQANWFALPAPFFFGRAVEVVQALAYLRGLVA